MSGQDSALFHLCDLIEAADVNNVVSAMSAVSDINVVPLGRSGGGGGPVHLAVERESEDVALVLMQHLLLCGLDVNLRNESGETALHLAVRRKFPHVVSLLRSFGADAGIKSSRGVLPGDLLEGSGCLSPPEDRLRLRVALESSTVADPVFTSFKRFSYESVPLSPPEEAGTPEGPSVCEFLHKIQDIFVDKIASEKVTSSSALKKTGATRDEEDFEAEFRDTVRRLSGLFGRGREQRDDKKSLFGDVSRCSNRSFCTSTLTPSSRVNNAGKSQKEIFADSKYPQFRPESVIPPRPSHSFLSVSEELVHRDDDFGIEIRETRKASAASIDDEDDSFHTVEEDVSRISLLKSAVFTWERKPVPSYPFPLQDTVQSLRVMSENAASWWDYERELADQFGAFDAATKRRVNATTREGLLRSSFNYLLLDPRKTQNLPLKCVSMDEGEAWNIFLSSVFYVGKGTRSRPMSHLYNAVKRFGKQKGNNVCAKTETILDIWNSGQGVVCLQVFNHSLHAEALSREAAMIDSIGVHNLTNVKPGDYYGISASWSDLKKRSFGTLLLFRAFQIFLQEGEVQLKPEDMKCSAKK